MHTRYYFKSATDINADIGESIKTAFMGKPVVITVEDETDKTKVKRQFEIYKELWEQDTIVSSSTTEMIQHVAGLSVRLHRRASGEVDTTCIIGLSGR